MESFKTTVIQRADCLQNCSLPSISAASDTAGHANRPYAPSGRNGTLMTIMKGRGANRPLASYIYTSFCYLLEIT